MPRLPTITSSKLIAALESIDFIIDRQTGSHVVLWRETDNRRVVVPLHTRDLGRGLTLRIIKGAGLTRDEFEKLFSKK
jgi:predicted RNA binding protein YcfA (HicA-like mRNA interferase family)